jgi:hypothetical protein
MASDSPSREAALQARRLARALDAIETKLDTLELGADPDAVVRALADPVRAFDAVAKEALT